MPTHPPLIRASRSFPQAGGVPFWLDPGLNLLIVHVLDGKKAGYNEAESVRARTLTLSPKGSPRYLG